MSWKFKSILVLIVLVNGDDKYANFKTKRSKRFFQNLNTYFSKSTEATIIDIPKTNISRKPVYVFDNEYLCSRGAREYCNSTEFGKKLETSTPVTYLTPPQSKVEQFPKYDHPASDTQNFNGYVYPTPNSYEDNGKKNQFYFHSFHQETEQLKVSVNDVICIKSSRNGRFTVGLATSKSVPASPIIENGYTENLPQCSLTTINSTAFQINIQEPDLISCGVYYCSSDMESNLMCLTLRFPLISGIKTSDDISVRIQCRPQQQLLSHVKQLQLKPSHLNVNVGRSLPLIATISSGGAVQELHSDVTLYALTSIGYSQLIRNNDVVTLGEEIQLRGIIRQGDGWYYSRFGKVIVQRVLAPSSGYVYGENPDSVVVVADDGCVNSAMKSICPNAPFNDQTNPLVSMLNMKMFIFNNMKDGDELMMFVTMYGCVHYEDCFTDNNFCQNWAKGSRVRRSNNDNSINKTIDSTSEIKIKIRTKINKSRIIKCDQTICEEIDDKGEPSFRMMILFVCCVISLSVCVLYNYCSVSLTFKDNYEGAPSTRKGNSSRKINI